jgi:hypothetical protein
MNLVNVISNATPPSPGTNSSPAGAKVHFQDLFSSLAGPAKVETTKPDSEKDQTTPVSAKKSGPEKGKPGAPGADSKTAGDTQIAALAALIVPAVPVPSPIVTPATILSAVDTATSSDTADPTAVSPQPTPANLPVSPAVASLTALAPVHAPAPAVSEVIGTSAMTVPIPVAGKQKDAAPRPVSSPEGNTTSSTDPIPSSTVGTTFSVVPSTPETKIQHHPDLAKTADTQTSAETKLPAPPVTKKEDPGKTAQTQDASTPNQVANAANNGGKQDGQTSNAVPEVELHTLAKAVMARQLETGLRTNNVGMKSGQATSQKVPKNMSVLPEISTGNTSHADVEMPKPVATSKPTQSSSATDTQTDDPNTSLSVVTGNPKATSEGEQSGTTRSGNLLTRDSGTGTGDTPTPTSGTQQAAPARLPNQPNPETAPVMPGLSNASLVDRLRQSELNFGMRTGEFGRVEIRTQFSPHEMSARIFVDRSEMGHALRAELPGLQKNLSELDYSHPKITVLEQPAAMQMGDDRHSQRQQPTESSRTQEARTTEKESTKVAVLEVPSVDEGLSIRI